MLILVFYIATFSLWLVLEMAAYPVNDSGPAFSYGCYVV